MGILSRLFGGASSDTPAAPVTSEAGDTAEDCVHGNLVPRWDSAEDMGKADKVAHYHCESCGSDLAPAEAEAIRSTSGPADVIGGS